MSSGKKVIHDLIFIVCFILMIFLITGCERFLDNNGTDKDKEKGPGPLSNEWVEIGPAPISGEGYTGRVSAIAVSAKDENLYYVGGADGGVWKSEDAGSSWTPLTDFLPTTAIGTLAVDPTDDNIVYAGSGEANFANHSRYGLGLYKTTDGGRNWQVLAEKDFAGRCFSRILIDPDNTGTLYASITHAGGLPSFDFNIAAARGHWGADLPLGVWKSIDGGNTWTQLTNGITGDLSATDMIMDPSDSATLYAAVGHVFGDPRNGIYKSVDKGSSWKKLAGGLPGSQVGRIALAISLTNPQRIYASIINACDENGGGATTMSVFRSDDGGANWVSKYPGSIHATYGWYLNVIAVSPTKPDTAFVGGVQLYATFNGGDSWNNIQGIQHVDIHALVFDKAKRLLSGNDGGIYLSLVFDTPYRLSSGTDGRIYDPANSGSDWVALNNGLGIVQFYAGISLDPDNHDIIYAGTQDNGTLKRTGTGKNDWVQLFGGDGGCTGVRADDSSTVFLEYQGTGNIYKSTDYGTTFFRANTGINLNDANCFLPPYTFHPQYPSQMYYATQRMYKSSDGGESWLMISDDLTAAAGAAIRSFAISPSDPHTFYASTNDGRVLVSNSGGITWDVCLNNIPGWPRIMRQFAVDPFDHLTAYLAVSYFGVDQILVTNNGGKIWSHLNDLADIPVNTIALDRRTNPRVIYIGTDSGVYRSTDGGVTWNLHGTGLPNCAVIDMIVDSDNNRLIVATQGRGMWMVGI